MFVQVKTSGDTARQGFLLMRYIDDTQIAYFSHCINQALETPLLGSVKPEAGFVQQQQIWIFHHGPGQQA